MECNEAQKELTEFNLFKCFPIIVMVFIHDVLAFALLLLENITEWIKQQNNGRRDQMSEVFNKEESISKMKCIRLLFS